AAGAGLGVLVVRVPPVRTCGDEADEGEEALSAEAAFGDADAAGDGQAPTLVLDGAAEPDGLVELGHSVLGAGVVLQPTHADEALPRAGLADTAAEDALAVGAERLHAFEVGEARVAVRVAHADDDLNEL